MQMWYTMVYAILYVDVGKCGHFYGAPKGTLFNDHY